jgi:hypothetical protein
VTITLNRSKLYPFLVCSVCGFLIGTIAWKTMNDSIAYLLTFFPGIGLSLYLKARQQKGQPATRSLDIASATTSGMFVACGIWFFANIIHEYHWL